jgi:pimeloyl-ACP methyl ester carboxylesterase
MTKATAILIVHGAYFLPPAWTPFTNSLTDAGFIVRCPRLPTCADKTRTATLEDDVRVVQQAALELREQGHSILFLAHSYGGIVVSEAITPSFYSPTLSTNTNSNENEYENDKKGGVVSLIYLAAFLIRPSTSVADAMAAKQLTTPPSHVQLSDNADGTVYAQNAAEAFYNDLPSQKAEELARANVTHNSTAAIVHTVRNASWTELPTVYVQCVQDRALVFELQKILVDEAVAAAAQVADTQVIKRVTLDSRHCPFLSQQDKVLDIIKRAALAN